MLQFRRMRQMGVVATCCLLCSTQFRGAMAQFSKAGEPCRSNADCLQDWEFCQIVVPSTGTAEVGDREQSVSRLSSVCVHKDQFPMSSMEFASCFLIVAIIAFTNVGGLAGGAGIIIFLMMAIYQFDAKNAIALQNACGIAGGMTRYIMSLRQSHPLREGKGTLVDYNLISLMMPGAIVGASVGTIANLVLPGPLILAFFFISSCLSAYSGLRKYLVLRKTERTSVPLKHTTTNTCQLPPQDQSAQKVILDSFSKQDLENDIEPPFYRIDQVEALEGGESESVVVGPSKERRLRHADSATGILKLELQPTADQSSSSDKPSTQEKDSSESDEKLPARYTRRATIFKRQWSSSHGADSSAQLEKVIRRESSNWQPVKLAHSLGMVAILLVVQVLRGSGKEPSVVGVTRCQAADWGLQAALVAGGLAMTLVAVFMLRREYEYKKRIGYTFVPGDFKCTVQNAIKLPLAASCVGFVTALSGVGPGVAINAVLLRLDVHPQVSNETGQTLSIYIGISATVCLLMENAIALDYAFVLMAMVILGVQHGMKIQSGIMSYTGGKTQYLVLVMLIVVFVVVVSTSFMAVWTIIIKHNEGESAFTFSSYC